MAQEDNFATTLTHLKRLKSEKDALTTAKESAKKLRWKPRSRTSNF